ncbi:MAG TPA: TadE family protein [Actinomycetota bacterium]|nr:TadE family protein [Actinomycetota bacterium]
MLRRSRADQRGAAVLEFALVLPIVFVILVAVVQIGVIARDRLVLAQAARAGAREAAIQDSAEAVEGAARAGGAGLDPTRLRIEITRTGPRGSPVTVSLDYEVPVAGVLAGWLLPTSVTLRAGATTRQEFG